MTRVDPPAPSSPDAAADVLQRRARELARPSAAAAVAHTSEAVPMVEFTLARERFLLDAELVLAGFRLAGVTPLPGAVPPVTGLTSWRGLVLTLVDLRGAAGGSVAGLDDLARVLVVGHHGRPVCGVLADVVHGVVTVTPDAVSPPPDVRRGAAGLVRGVTRDARVVLDGGRLLALLEDPRHAAPNDSAPHPGDAAGPPPSREELSRR